MPIRVVTPYSRPWNVPALYNHLVAQGVVWHPLVFDTPWPEGYDAHWIDPFYAFVPDGVDPFCHKINAFARSGRIVDMDRYCLLCDDDMYGPGVLDGVRALTDRIVVVSMRRGDRTPETGRPHPATTLTAALENMRAGQVGLQQCLMLGEVFKRLVMPEDRPNICDGLAAEWLAENYGDEIKFMPDLFVHFNFLQPGRWDA